MDDKAVRHIRLINGPLTTLQLSHVDLEVATWSSYANVSADRRVIEFLSTASDLAGSVIAKIPDFSFAQEYEVQGGTLRVGQGRQLDPASDEARPLTVALWERDGMAIGAHHVGATDLEMVSLFSAFSISATDEGVSMSPTTSQARLVAPFSAVFWARDFGLIEVRERTAALERSLPSEEGKRTSGGELYVSNRDSAARHFTLVGEAAVSFIHPNLDVEEERLSGVLDSLRATIGA